MAGRPAAEVLALWQSLREAGTPAQAGDPVFFFFFGGGEGRLSTFSFQIFYQAEFLEFPATASLRACGLGKSMGPFRHVGKAVGIWASLALGGMQDLDLRCAGTAIREIAKGDGDIEPLLQHILSAAESEECSDSMRRNFLTPDVVWPQPNTLLNIPASPEQGTVSHPPPSVVQAKRFATDTPELGSSFSAMRYPGYARSMPSLICLAAHGRNGLLPFA